MAGHGLKLLLTLLRDALFFFDSNTRGFFETKQDEKRKIEILKKRRIYFFSLFLGCCPWERTKIQQRIPFILWHIPPSNSNSNLIHPQRNSEEEMNNDDIRTLSFSHTHTSSPFQFIYFVGSFHHSISMFISLVIIIILYTIH
mmetsp:Transcript_45192/g.45767  ORF Transcript_45192/g.45767 Transcript_45192/m.45767 type:complete len:143 (-) Transcript_45192:358-786(-)